jgi:2,3-bisphosphoglycerate-independent phosphoglycerate mutase
MQQAAVKHLPLFEGMNPKIFFYRDGHGVLIVDAPPVRGLPRPPKSAILDDEKLRAFRPFITRLSLDLQGLTLMPWGGGASLAPRIFGSLRSAKPIVVVSKDPTVLGVAKVLGLPKVGVDHLWSGFREALRLIQSSSVILHVKETDEVSHRRATDQKISLLWEIDQLLQQNAPMLRERKVAIMVDHGTSSLTGEHLDMDVPFSVSEGVIPVESIRRFSESAAKCVRLNELLQHIENY